MIARCAGGVRVRGALFGNAGFTVESYTYYDADKRGVMKFLHREGQGSFPMGR